MIERRAWEVQMPILLSIREGFFKGNFQEKAKFSKKSFNLPFALVFDFCMYEIFFIDILDSLPY
jgi:hypothetical protein